VARLTFTNASPQTCVCAERHGGAAHGGVPANRRGRGGRSAVRDGAELVDAGAAHAGVRTPLHATRHNTGGGGGSLHRKLGPHCLWSSYGRGQTGDKFEIDVVGSFIWVRRTFSRVSLGGRRRTADSRGRHQPRDRHLRRAQLVGVRTQATVRLRSAPAGEEAPALGKEWSKAGALLTGNSYLLRRDTLDHHASTGGD